MMIFRCRSDPRIATRLSSGIGVPSYRNGNFITLEVYEDNAVINVTQGGLPTRAKGRVTLQAHKDQAMITLNKGGLPPNTKSLILLGVNDDSSRIRIKDHSGGDFIVDSQKLQNIMKNSR